MLAKFWQSIRHNQTLIISFIVCGVLLYWGFACVPETRSPRDYSKKVTRAELDIEVQIYAKEVSLAYADLDKQEAVRNAILNAGLAYAKGEGFSIVGLMTTLMGILGVGAAIDNRRKDAVIKSKTNALNAYIHNTENNNK